MMTDNKNEEKPIFGIFSIDEVKALKEEYNEMGDPIYTLNRIATPIFHKFNIRSWCEAEKDVQDLVRRYFLNIQATVLTVPVTHYITVEHKKGDCIRDSHGDPIPSDDGKDYKKYTKDVTERIEKQDEKPYYDVTKNSGALNDIIRKLKEIEVLPDYTELRKKYLASTDFKKTCDIIRQLTNYYIFDDPDQFVERFALLLCNAKAKALGYQPKWAVLFSLVGGMGIGKSWLAQMVKDSYDKAFGCRSQVTSYGRLLDGQFNAMMMTRGFLSLDEAQGLDKGQCEKLKTYITSQKVDIERKGIDVQTCDNLVTFFSTTNESVKEVMGYQPDRRIVEFYIAEKKGEIPEDTLKEWLDQLWLVCPIEHPHADAIKTELLETSTNLLDLNMGDVVYEIFKDGIEQFTSSNGRINVFKLRRKVKELGGVPFNRVRDWCVTEMIFKLDREGRLNLSRKGLKAFYAKHGEEAPDTQAYSVEQELDNLFKVEG